ncbi:hypothetical protein C3495_05670 [Clostridiaceae bacterium 14S0207]|nr:hypothetical protein C3495_05670 [Clostridiaceae bacterium 14S0207]
MEKEIEELVELSLTDILSEVIQIEHGDNRSEQIENISADIIQYYKIHEGRHLYSEVSTFLYNTKEDDFEYIFANLEDIKRYLEQVNNKYALKIYKLIDHIKLEQLRLFQLKLNQENNAKKLIDTIEHKTLEYSEKINKMDISFKEINNKYKKQKKSIDELNNQIISIIGIFSAIVITFFGGMNLLGSALNNMHNVSKYRIIFVILITGFVVFNIIFMLLYYVNRLIGRCIQSKLEQLNISYIKEKYPIVYFYDLISLILMLSLFIIFITDKYNVLSYILSFIDINNKYNLIPICGLICGLIFGLICGFLIYILMLCIKKKKTKKDCKI